MPLASLHAGEILDAAALPLRYAGFSTCFRREAGAAGKDTRGIFRVHQFDKVEMFAFVPPEESQAEHERLLAIEEEILQALEHPLPRGEHRRLATSAPPPRRSTTSRRGCPGRARYRELTSCSNTTDYQARRLGHPLPAGGRRGRRTCTR